MINVTDSGKLHKIIILEILYLTLCLTAPLQIADSVSNKLRFKFASKFMLFS